MQITTLKHNIDPYQQDKLIVYTLGRFEVNRGYHRLYQSSSRSRKLWDLFKYMLTYKNKTLSLEMIYENVFPEDNYENPRNVLKNSVYRLRKLLGGTEALKYSYIVSSSECYKFDSSNVWVDVDCFEELLDQAELMKKSSPEEAIVYYKEAIALYTGDYLNEYSNMDWVVPSRSYYKRLYLQCCLGLIDIMEEKQDYKEVLNICEQFMRIEPYEEEIHICFIQALIMKGQIKEALKHYEYCTSSFYRAFGIKPSNKMKRLYESMKKDNYGQEDTKVKTNSTDFGKNGGAFYCDSRIFKSIIQLENRKKERNGHDQYLGSIILRIDKCTDNKYIQEIIEAVRKIIGNDLRKGDAFTQWADNEFLIMLEGLTMKQIEKTLKRVIEHIERVLKLDGIKIYYKLIAPKDYTYIINP